jgi:hypothetical protein
MKRPFSNFMANSADLDFVLYEPAHVYSVLHTKMTSKKSVSDTLTQDRYNRAQT